jgi:orotidine-5'-phosphate decarboxylase
MSSGKSRLIVALDLPGRAAAMDMVQRLEGRVGYFKIGLELFIREGPRIVEEIGGRGEKVFLDLKLHDIPNTVAGAVRSACRLGVQMLTVHSAGGPRMLEAARKAADDTAEAPLLLAVTALTSLSDDDCRHIGVQNSITSWVDRLSRIAVEAGIGGLVGSPREATSLRSRFGGRIKLVVPGIRPAGSVPQDQSRTATPREAIAAGADYIVVGRPILQAADPREAANEIASEIALALEQGA